MDYAKKLVCIALVCIAGTLAISVGPEINCAKVYETLEPCLGYIRGRGSSTPSSDCCNGVNTAFHNAKTIPDHQQTCQCLKDAANRFPKMFDAKLVAVLPSSCGVNLPYNISTSTDCKRIK